MTTTVTLEVVPQTLLIADVCRLLRISRSQFYRQQAWLRDLGLLHEVVPALDHRPRFRGEPIARWLSDAGQAGQLRQALRRVR